MPVWFNLGYGLSDGNETSLWRSNANMLGPRVWRGDIKPKGIDIVYAIGQTA